MTAYAFHRREVGAIIDSSKVSQMRTAHHRGVAYQGDQRNGAEWMRCRVLVGVETMVVMAAAFGPNRGLRKTHDSLYLEPLMLDALKTFKLHYLLGDKAYWAERTSIRQWSVQLWVRSDQRRCNLASTFRQSSSEKRRCILAVKKLVSPSRWRLPRAVAERCAASTPWRGERQNRHARTRSAICVTAACLVSRSSPGCHIEIPYGLPAKRLSC